MNELAIDSSVVAKWILPESDSPKANQLLVDGSVTGQRLIVLDLAFSEVANAIWKKQRRHLISPKDADDYFSGLFSLPISAEPAFPLLKPAYEIAVKYDRAIYDALFVALAVSRGAQGVTADEPLFNALRQDFPMIRLLRDL